MAKIAAPAASEANTPSAAQIVTTTSRALRRVIHLLVWLPRYSKVLLELQETPVLDLTSGKLHDFLTAVIRLSREMNAICGQSVDHYAFAVAYLEMCKASGIYRDLMDWSPLVNDNMHHSYHMAGFMWARRNVCQIIGTLEGDRGIDYDEDSDDQIMFELADGLFENRGDLERELKAITLPPNGLALLALEEIQALLILKDTKPLWETETSPDAVQLFINPLADRNKYIYSRRVDGAQWLVIVDDVNEKYPDHQLGSDTAARSACKSHCKEHGLEMPRDAKQRGTKKYQTVLNS